MAGLVRRARRVADLSQRDLAVLLGVCQATVAHWETGRRAPGLRDFEGLLRLAGLQLLVVVADLAETPAETPTPTDVLAEDAATQNVVPQNVVPQNVVPHKAVPHRGPHENDAHENFTPRDAEPADVPVDARGGVLPMRDDGVRDGATRRYPAHLDPAALYQVWRPRWDRPELNVQCHRRRGRDTQRARVGAIPVDHLTPDDVLATLTRWRAERHAKIRRSLPQRPTTDPTTQQWCSCPIDCEEHDGPCPDNCPCGCEPDPWYAR